MHIARFMALALVFAGTSLAAVPALAAEGSPFCVRHVATRNLYPFCQKMTYGDSRVAVHCRTEPTASLREVRLEPAAAWEWADLGHGWCPVWPPKGPNPDSPILRQ